MKRVAIIAPLSLAMEERPDPTPMDDEILIRCVASRFAGPISTFPRNIQWSQELSHHVRP